MRILRRLFARIFWQKGNPENTLKRGDAVMFITARGIHYSGFYWHNNEYGTFFNNQHNFNPLKCQKWRLE